MMNQPAPALPAAPGINPAPAANRARLTLALFEGKDDAKMTRDFCLKVDGYQAVARLTDAETAQAVSFAVAPASAFEEWITGQTEETPAAVGLWTTLRPLIMDRFTPELTASERAAAADHCRQAKGENVLQFLDKCRSMQLMQDRDVPDAEKIGDFLDGHQRRYQAGVLQLFLRGLREEGGLKAHVNGAVGCANLPEYKSAAVKYERHVTKNAKVTVAEMTTQEDQEEDDGDDDAEVANLKGKRNSKKQKGGNNSNAQKGNNGNNRGGGGRGGGGARGGAAATPGAPRLCWTCNSPQHLSFKCPQGNPVGKKNTNQGKNQQGETAMHAGIYQLGMNAFMRMAQGNQETRHKQGEPLAIDYLQQQPQQQQTYQQQGFW